MQTYLVDENNSQKKHNGGEIIEIKRKCRKKMTGNLLHEVRVRKNQEVYTGQIKATA